ncbi:amyloid-beta A4 precursor protein-binding family A member 1-like isoform X6 [Malaya genurostris]|uniref:amyloid-beta A4 precursor protein-binding family A member 1-like isoform X6 n=1 Tax=Malaya genurostris TaxID=325434 RepID=UPI0026F3B348|nr:amyloid-beta A4 precursor protein-binding family A member 1-like isoform X6 [Malaya genurostris]
MSYANGTQLKSSSTGTAGNGGTTNGTGGAGPPRYPAPPGRPQNYTIYSKDSDRLLWEMRAVNHRTPNTTPASTVLNSPDLTDLDTKMRYQHSTLMQHHQIKVGRSPVGSGGNNDSNNSTNPSSPTQIGGPGGAVLLGGSQGGRQQFSSFSLLSDGEMVVFDDIESVGGWRMSSGRDILGSSPVPSENDDSGADGVVGADRDDDDEKKYYDVDSTKKQRIIGGLTIAEYEGSPRRFGTIDRNEANPHGAAAGGRIPKPGFPKRVISPSPSETHQRLPYEPHSELINLNDDDDDNNDNLANDGNRDEVTGSRNAPSDRLSGDLNGLPGHVGSGVTGDPGTDYGRLYSSMPILEDGLSSGHASDTENNLPPPGSGISIVMDQQSVIAGVESEQERTADVDQCEQQELDSCDEVQEAIKDIKAALQKTKILPSTEGSSTLVPDQEGTSTISPVWVPRAYSKSRESLDSDQPAKLLSADEEEADTDLETDRLLGQQRLDEHGFVDDKSWTERPKIRSVRSPGVPLISKNHTAIRAGLGTQLSAESPVNNVTLTNLYGNGGSVKVASSDGDELKQLATVIADSSPEHISDPDKKGKCKTKEGLLDPTVLIEGVLFRARYLGSTQLVCEGQPTKSTRMMQAEEAVSRIKAPEGETQPSTEVDLFISTEKIMVLNTDLKEIMMDHALRTISYIADIGDLVVLMARRRFVPQDTSESGDPAAPLTTGQQTTAITADAGGGSSPPPKKSVSRGNRTPKMICHVFESAEAQFIAQSIGQAFQVAYMEFLKANGIEDHSFMKEMDYQEVLNSQEIFGDELEIFAKKELQKEVVVPKAKGEILGVVIVESGWGSMLPTVVIANLSSSGAAARCGQLNIGDQIIAINGLSLVGLPLSTCQGYIKNTKTQTAVKFTVVPCAPVVEVRIKRPNTKYQLGFSVQNGVICSLLRGGIAERGGVRVGHRIIEINSQSVVAVPHEKIVNLLATSVGEIHMKTMPTSMFRLLTGQENPIYI